MIFYEKQDVLMCYLNVSNFIFWMCFRWLGIVYEAIANVFYNSMFDTVLILQNSVGNDSGMGTSFESIGMNIIYNMVEII